MSEAPLYPKPRIPNCEPKPRTSASWVGGTTPGLAVTPYTLHPSPYTLHPTPYTLHLTPYTLHPTPYTLHPTPYTPGLAVKPKGPSASWVGGSAPGLAVTPPPCRGYSKLRTHPAIGPYGRSIPRSIGPSQGRCVSLLTRAIPV